MEVTCTVAQLANFTANAKSAEVVTHKHMYCMNETYEFYVSVQTHGLLLN